MKETYIKLEEAYIKKKYNTEHPELFYQTEIRKERRAKGICTECGIKKLTEIQKRRGLTRCLKCRIKRRS